MQRSEMIVESGDFGSEAFESVLAKIEGVKALED
jgi:hypothetical protein